MRAARSLRFLALLVAFGACGAVGPAQAQEERAEQARLAEQIRAHPTDYESTYRYVLISTELRDYEAAIGALERLLMFNPKLSRARKELGFLYARMGAYQVAAQHMRAALNSGDLDPVQKAQIEAQLPDIEKHNQRSRLSGSLQVGLRSQSNANYFPANGLFQVGGVGLFSSSGARKSDWNSFQNGAVAHDYEFENGRGDQFESRGTIYATQQFRLPQYNVAVFSGSLGPRVVVAQDVLPGLSVKPYLVGLASIVGDANYLNAGGAGVSLRATPLENVTIEPGFEWRSLWVRRPGIWNGGLYASLSTLASGDATTAYVGGSVRASDDIRLDWRAAFSHASAALASQSSDQVDLQAMLRLEIDPPAPQIGRRWTIAPYARFTSLAFEAANSLVDPWRVRKDPSWTYGVMLDAPINANLGFAGHLEYSRNDSSVPNFKTQNLSVSFGPMARF